MIFLHHYPASLFSEKIRLLLGHYDLAWQSVEISSIMPRPLLMPLSGGYRRTPVLQIGANIYADTKVISAALARHVGDDELYSGGFLAHRTADWADSQLFRVVVALNFRRGWGNFLKPKRRLLPKTAQSSLETSQLRDCRPQRRWPV